MPLECCYDFLLDLERNGLGLGLGLGYNFLLDLERNGRQSMNESASE